MTARLAPALGALALGLAFALAARADVAGALWKGFGGEAKLAVEDERLLALAGEHLVLALAALALGGGLGAGLGIVVTRPWAGAGARALVDGLGTASQAVPPVVVVALALPVFGFGAAPTVLALVLYALLPVLRGTAAALASLPAEVREAARASGFTPTGALWRIELPLAAPSILESLRVALVLVVATASVGAFAGAATLGTPILAGLQNQNDLEIWQGAAATAAVAFLADGAFLLATGALVRPVPT